MNRDFWSIFWLESGRFSRRVPGKIFAFPSGLRVSFVGYFWDDILISTLVPFLVQRQILIITNKKLRTPKIF
jgi:hypothetical protein